MSDWIHVAAIFRIDSFTRDLKFDEIRIVKDRFYEMRRL